MIVTIVVTAGSPYPRKMQQDSQDSIGRLPSGPGLGLHVVDIMAACVSLRGLAAENLRSCSSRKTCEANCRRSNLKRSN